MLEKINIRYGRGIPSITIVSCGMRSIFTAIKYDKIVVVLKIKNFIINLKNLNFNFDKANFKIG